MDTDELNALRCGTCLMRYEIGGQLICPVTGFPITPNDHACISHSRITEFELNKRNDIV